ncbi:MAG: hypothetical protein WCH99_13750 [Verrucomicrobiota bacterium]
MAAQESCCGDCESLNSWRFQVLSSGDEFFNYAFHMASWDTIKSVATKLVHDELQTLQVRLFRLIVLAIAIICLFVVVPVNLLVGLPWVENLLTVLLAGFGLVLYRQSLKGKNYTRIL